MRMVVGRGANDQQRNYTEYRKMLRRFQLMHHFIGTVPSSPDFYVLTLKLEYEYDTRSNSLAESSKE